MQIRHESWLDSVHAQMLTAQGADPYGAFATIDPASTFGAINQKPGAALDNVYGLSLFAMFTEHWDNLQGRINTISWDSPSAASANSAWLDSWVQSPDIGIQQSVIDAAVNAQADLLADRLTRDVLPRFRQSMQEAGAVLSSAFVLGQAYLEADNLRETQKLSTDLRVQGMLNEQGLSVELGKLHATVYQAQLSARRQEESTKIQTLAQVASGMTQAEQEKGRQTAVLSTEMTRILISAQTDVDRIETEMAAKSALWDLETWQYSCNVMASIAGAAVRHTPTTATAQTAIGGALSGAAIGAQIGSLMPGVGTAAGAGVGALLGLAAGIL
jgi:hypothetical protein